MDNVKIIPPFKGWVLENFPFIEADFDAITNYQLICKVIEYLNKVIDSENEQNTVIEDLYNKFIQLKNYVDNLDLQDEVNNKLDEMAESGELADIVAQYIELKGLLIYNTVDDMKNATNLANGSTAKTLGFYNIGDNGSSYYIIRNITNLDVIDNITIIALSNENLIAELKILNGKPLPQQFGAYGDNEHVDNISLNKYFEYCCNNGYIANGNNKSYLIDNSTQSYCEHTGLKVPSGIEICNFNFNLKSGSPHFNTILACKYSNNNYYIHNCNFTGELRNPTGASGEDGGNHGIIFCDGEDMFPSDWQNFAKILIENCNFNNIQSYCIFPTPLNNDLIIRNCDFKSHGPAILTYATNSLIENCLYTYLDSTGTTIHTLCIDEIENFSNPTDILKNTTIKNCKTSNRLYDINHAVQTGLNYGNIIIFNCESNRELFVSNASSYNLNIQKLIIKDSENKTNSGDSGFYISQITGDVILDNVKVAKNSRIIVTGNIELKNMIINKQIYLGSSVITDFKIINCTFEGSQSEGFISCAGATTIASITKLLFLDCDFNTRSIIMRSLNTINLIMQNIRSIGYTGRYVYNPTQQSTNVYIDGLIMDTANTGSDFIIDGCASVIINGVGKAVLLHNVITNEINMLDIT